MKKLFALVSVAMLLGLGLSGCATVIDLGKDVCEAAVGGSKLGELCPQLDKLREDQPADEAPAE